MAFETCERHPTRKMLRRSSKWFNFGICAKRMVDVEHFHFGPIWTQALWCSIFSVVREKSRLKIENNSKSLDISSNSRIEYWTWHGEKYIIEVPSCCAVWFPGNALPVNAIRLFAATQQTQQKWNESNVELAASCIDVRVTHCATWQKDKIFRCLHACTQFMFPKRFWSDEIISIPTFIAWA